MGFFASVLDLLFPPKCVFCGKVLGGSVSYCEACAKKLPFTKNGGRQDGEFYDFCVSPLYYKDEVRRSILRFKFKGATAYAEAYGRILADCIRQNLAGEYDVISWVPLSTKRAHSRGYDQSMLLALAAALELDDVAAETLRKPQDVKAQSTITDKETRKANISGAYEAADPELVDGKRILLIDDIITTGATLSECARVLLLAGAERIICASLARSE